MDSQLSNAAKLRSDGPRNGLLKLAIDGRLDADSTGYLSLEGLTGGVKDGRSRYCTSCYTGNYPVAFPRDEAAYLQLALKLNHEPASADRPGPVVPPLETDPVPS